MSLNRIPVVLNLSKTTTNEAVWECQLSALGVGENVQRIELCAVQIRDLAVQQGTTTVPSISTLWVDLDTSNSQSRVQGLLLASTNTGILSAPPGQAASPPGIVSGFPVMVHTAPFFSTDYTPNRLIADYTPSVGGMTSMKKITVRIRAIDTLTQTTTVPVFSGIVLHLAFYCPNRSDTIYRVNLPSSAW